MVRQAQHDSYSNIVSAQGSETDGEGSEEAHAISISIEFL